MQIEDEDINITEASVEVIKLAAKLEEEYGSAIAAGVLTATGLAVYRSFLTEEDYSAMIDNISDLSHSNLHQSSKTQTRVLH